MGFEETGYPENINLATSRIYNKLNAQFINRVTDRPGDDVWEIIAQE